MCGIQKVNEERTLMGFILHDRDSSEDDKIFKLLQKFVTIYIFIFVESRGTAGVKSQSQQRVLVT